LLGSCSSGDRGSGLQRVATDAGGPRAAADVPRSSPAPTLPSHDAAELARQVDWAVATVRDPAASADEVRQAAELQQLAVRELAAASTASRHDVVGRLSPAAARETAAQVRAARLLSGLASPRKALPSWRIVAARPPRELKSYYRLAQRRTGVPWSYLAAINLVESRMGRIRGTSTAGAQGPMQFMPATWRIYGAGGDINDPRDSILAAARLLESNGALRSMSRALWHYNQSHAYVRAVTAYARTMQRAPAAYRGYWCWRVLFRTTRGTYVLPVGYPRSRAALLPGG
jgi:membrane-bound lytic murein transglycosylase B